jgi:hypothetical protein
MNDPNFGEPSSVGFLQVIRDDTGQVTRKKGVKIEGILDRNVLRQIPDSQFSILKFPQTSSISTVSGIAALATLEMMQYFSASASVFSTWAFCDAIRDAGTRA